MLLLLGPLAIALVRTRVPLAVRTEQHQSRLRLLLLLLHRSCLLPIIPLLRRSRYCLRAVRLRSPLLYLGSRATPSLCLLMLLLVLSVLHLHLYILLFLLLPLWLLALRFQLSLPIPDLGFVQGIAAAARGIYCLGINAKARRLRGRSARAPSPVSLLVDEVPLAPGDSSSARRRLAPPLGEDSMAALQDIRG